MFKKIIIFFCASLLLLGVAGCTDNDGKKTDNNETDGNVKCSEILEEILTEATGTHTDKKLFYDDESCYNIAICQNCGRHFERYYDEQANYCPTCGQRLDWEDEEEVTE